MTSSEVRERILQLFDAERRRQILEEKFDEHADDLYKNGDLALAAASYLLPPEHRPIPQHTSKGVAVKPPKVPPIGWPWAAKWWKPTPEDRLRELVKAGALLVAEVERLVRAGIATLPDRD